MQIYDNRGELYFSRLLDDKLVYYTNDLNNSLTWLDFSKKNICLNFSFDMKVISPFKLIMSTSIIEFLKQENFEQIVKKESKNWDDYYMGENTPGNEEENVIYEQYGGKDELELEE